MSDKISANENGIALDGFDVVAYQNDMAIMGDGQYTYDWGGATFWFMNQANLDAFCKAPARYLPEYNGHCAFGIGFGKAVHANPKVFTRINGKLYLNASPMARRCWRWFGSVEKSDARWEKRQKSDAQMR